METLNCIVERITYSSEETGYTVLRVKIKKYADLITVVGNLATVNVGAVLNVYGEWKIDSKYGRQFSAVSWEESLPASVYGIEKYLGSGLIKGIGPKYAKRIVSVFGKDTLNVIEEEPERLLEVEGISNKRLLMIKKAWESQKEIKNIMLFLQEHDVSTSHAFKIFKTYGNESISTVKENPYRMADDIWGIGFKTADIIAQKLGFDRESYFRCRSGVLFALSEFSNEGHCYVPSDELIQKTSEMLDIEIDKIHITVFDMIEKKDIFSEKKEFENRIYLPPFYYSETGTAKKLRKLLNAPKREIDADNIIGRIEKKLRIKYDEVQKEAIKTAVNSKIMILTGGPGTGKTTTTAGIINIFRAAGLNVLLAAPTGRAAKRLSETTGLEAKTIHRLLEYRPPEGYQINEDNPLDGDVLIVDECSMIDILLMYNLLKAIPASMTLIFVGDSNQLPSVGAGNALHDMINSKVIPTVNLTRIFRQSQGSQIVMNAHRINAGEYPYLNSSKYSDFFYIEQEEPTGIAEIIVELYSERLPRHYNVNPFTDIQVLCPMQRGDTGAWNMNTVLQNTLNKSDVLLKKGGTEYRLNDKVMQIKNNYDKGVFNGDIGTISSVNQAEKELAVAFDGVGEVNYDISELDELVLSYAVTVHKSQGSEYPIVIIPVTTQHYMMLQRNLLYTAITRAKKILILVGTKKAISIAVRNNASRNRYTALSEMLTEQHLP